MDFLLAEDTGGMSVAHQHFEMFIHTNRALVLNSETEPAMEPERESKTESVPVKRRYVCHPLEVRLN